MKFSSLRMGRYSLLMHDSFARRARYSKHVHSVQNSKSRIDVKPQPVLTSTFLNVQKVKADHYSMKRILRANIDLIRKMNSIQLHRGCINTYNQFKPIQLSRRRSEEKRLINLQRSNLKLACRLLRIKSSMDTRRGLEEMRKVNSLKHHIAPKWLLERYENIVTTDHGLLQKILRPKIYFDLAVKNIRPLGRVEVQLFTEACPELVLQFVRNCTYRRVDVFHFIRIFPLLWIEGELEVDNQILSRPNFEYKMHVLDHGMGPGVLSFAKPYLQGFPPGLLNFTISFKPLPVLRGERIPFGLVTHGLKVIDCLQDYGTKNGKTIKNIVIVKCGLNL